MKRNQLILTVILFFSLMSVALAKTQLTYQETRVPMAEAGAKGLEALFVWPNDSTPHPVVLISHGAPRDYSKRPDMSAIASLPVAMEFARRGFAVAVVMRRGYGTSGGECVESLSGCASPNYLHSAMAASKDLHAVVAYLKTLPQFDVNKIIAVGVSAGGFSTVAFTADNPPPGLVAAISFAGGRGSKASDTVCQENQLIDAFGTLGKTSRVPMLWVYSENDHFFNPVLAKHLYDAFTKSGGHATLKMVAPYKEEGHFLFSTAGISVWTPLVDDFLKSQNLVMLDELLPLPTGDLKVPATLSAQGKEDFASYSKSAPHKAFAMSQDGAYGWRTGQRSIAEAKKGALGYCQEHANEACHVIALDNAMVAE